VTFQDRAEGSFWGGSEGSKVKDTASDDAKRTRCGVAGGAVADGLAANAIFLCRKVERNIISVEDACDGRGGGIEVGVADGEGDVAEAEGMRLRVGAALAVLPGAEKEEESHDGQIRDAALTVGCGDKLGDGGMLVDEELERDGSHARGRWVLLGVGAELAGEPEIGGADAVVSGVRGPHAGKDLGHGAKVLLHGPLANRLTVGGKVAGADLVGEHLEERDRVADAGEGWIEAELGAEEAPLAPVGAIGRGAARMDASGNLVLAKAVDSPCCCCDVRCNIFQDFACGNSRLKKEQSCESDSSQRREAASAR
jgi:hypothetical protein